MKKFLCLFNFVLLAFGAYSQSYLPDPSGMVGITATKEGGKYSIVVLSLKEKPYGVDSVFTKIPAIDSSVFAAELLNSINLYKQRNNYILKLIEEYESGYKAIEVYEDIFADLTGQQIDDYEKEKFKSSVPGTWILLSKGKRDTLTFDTLGAIKLGLGVRAKKDAVLYFNSAFSVVLAGYYDNEEVKEMQKQLKANKLEYTYDGIVYKFKDKKEFQRAIKRKNGVEFIDNGNGKYISKQAQILYKL